MSKFPYLFAACALLGASVGVAQNDAEPVKEVEIGGGPPPSEPACFNVRDARSFSALDDEYIYVQGRRDQHFLLTMFRGCIDLRSSIRIALSNDVSRVCSNSFAAVTYRGISGLETCRVRRVEAVEDKASAEALVKSRSERR